MAVGRAPNTAGLGLPRAGVTVDRDGSIKVDRFCRTNVDNIFAIGDVATPLQLTPVAIRQGAGVAEILFGGRETPVDYSQTPTAVFSHPEVGVVGMTEEIAIGRFPAIDIYRSRFQPLQNMITGRDERVLLKLVVDAQSDRVVGCHIVGPGSSEMAQLLAIPLKMNATKTDFDAAVALHPTISEEIVTMRVPVARHRWDVAGRRSGPISI